MSSSVHIDGVKMIGRVEGKADYVVATGSFVRDDGDLEVNASKWRCSSSVHHLITDILTEP